jgi:hypothetical protein
LKIRVQYRCWYLLVRAAGLPPQYPAGSLAQSWTLPVLKATRSAHVPVRIGQLSHAPVSNPTRAPSGSTIHLLLTEEAGSKPRRHQRLGRPLTSLCPITQPTASGDRISVDEIDSPAVDVPSLRVLLVVLIGWLDHGQHEALASLFEENRILRVSCVGGV